MRFIIDFFFIYPILENYYFDIPFTFKVILNTDGRNYFKYRDIALLLAFILDLAFVGVCMVSCV